MNVISRLEAIEGLKIPKAHYFQVSNFNDHEFVRSIFSDDVEIDF